MNKFLKSMLNLSELEQLASRKTWPNQLHPTFKILLTLSYIFVLAALGKYELDKILLFGIYPILVISIFDIPHKMLLGKLIIPAFMSISLGMFNPIFNQETMLVFMGIPISGGIVSLVSLFIKAIYSIMAALLLVSTTSMEALGRGLIVLKVPKKLVVLLLIMYRYIDVLLSEVGRTIEAYQLRASSKKSIHISTWGSLVGQIMIRSYKRSQEIYSAMLLRGYYSDGR